jgi:hypothetical protein
VTLPELTGKPITLRVVPALRDRHGSVHAGSHLRRREMHFEWELMSDRREFARVFVHELFHFVWVRLGNPLRRSFEDLLAAELRRRASGELGWSAEWRKRLLTTADRRRRTRRWREYVCESFCDSAAWMFAGLRRHGEFTLAPSWRNRRRAWFRAAGVTRRVSI